MKHALNNQCAYPLSGWLALFSHADARLMPMTSSLQGEILGAAKWIQATNMYSVPAPQTVLEDKKMKVVQHMRPVGVVAAICPWNYPGTLATEPSRTTCTELSTATTRHYLRTMLCSEPTAPCYGS